MEPTTGDERESDAGSGVGGVLESRWAPRLRCFWVCMRARLCVARWEPETRESAGLQRLGCAGWGEPGVGLGTAAAAPVLCVVACISAFQRQ